MLDPAQNHTFRDHYLEVDLDLSDVLFLATANVLDTIPGPLLDRMEVVRLDGYTEDEKVAIARDHLLPRQLERAGLTRRRGRRRPTTRCASIAADYTREAGVRQLERELGKVLRKVADRSSPADDADAPVAVDADDARDLPRPAAVHRRGGRAHRGARRGHRPRGHRRRRRRAVRRGDRRWTGEPGLTLTGQLGDVMKESAQIALSYLRSHGARARRSTGRRSTDRGVHVHVPAGRGAQGRPVAPASP